MLTTGIALTVMSDLFNGSFTAPMKRDLRSKWENIWLVFIIVACLVMPIAVVSFSSSGWFRVLGQAPWYAVLAALTFGFACGFDAICFGKSVD